MGKEKEVTQEMVVTQMMLIGQADGSLNKRIGLFNRVRNLRLPERAKACIKAAKILGDEEVMKAAKDRLKVLSKAAKGGAS